MAVRSEAALKSLLKRLADGDRKMTFSSAAGDIVYFLYLYEYSANQFSVVVKYEKVYARSQRDALLDFGVCFALRVPRSLDNFDASRLIRAIDECYNRKVCPACQYHVIRDKHEICTECHLTASDDDLRVHFCSICQQETCGMLATRMACCDQYLHTTCLRKWHGACPLCRAGGGSETL